MLIILKSGLQIMSTNCESLLINLKIDLQLCIHLRNTFCVLFLALCINNSAKIKGTFRTEYTVLLFYIHSFKPFVHYFKNS